MISAILSYLPAGAWNLFTMTDTMTKDGQKFVTAFGILLGVILFAYGAYMMAKAVMSKQGRAGTIGIALFAIVVGGFLSFGAFERLKGLGDGAGQQINTWGGGSN